MPYTGSDTDLVDLQGQITTIQNNQVTGLAGLQTQIKQVTLALEGELATLGNAFTLLKAFVTSQFGIVLGAPSTPSSSPLQIASVHIASAALKTLKTSPILLVAAQGAGKIISVVTSLGIVTAGNIPFSNDISSGLFYDAGLTLELSAGPLAINAVGNLSTTWTVNNSLSGPSSGVGVTDLANKPLYLSDHTADAGPNGNGFADIMVVYYVMGT